MTSDNLESDRQARYDNVGHWVAEFFRFTLRDMAAAPETYGGRVPKSRAAYLLLKVYNTAAECNLTQDELYGVVVSEMEHFRDSAEAHQPTQRIIRSSLQCLAEQSCDDNASRGRASRTRDRLHAAAATWIKWGDQLDRDTTWDDVDAMR